jgi:hypothetical protein
MLKEDFRHVFFCGNSFATPCHLMFRRRACLRVTPVRKQAPSCSAATTAPWKNLILPQDKFARNALPWFAARLAGAVDVRDLRESQAPNA